MSASQANASPQGSQRVDEAPVVPTKAKMNHSLLRGSTSEFGMDSMFESTSRQRQTLPDEDAPPTSSVNDIPNEVHFNTSNARIPPKRFAESPFSRRARAPTSQQTNAPIYVVVFGYPLDKYSVTVEYFKSLGESTEADPNADILNCFRIGYYDAGDAMRAVRKNGEVLGGSWMIGAKWADPAQAEALLGQPISRAGYSSQATDIPSSSNAMMVDETPASSGSPMTTTPMVGTPIKLAPSASAFRRTAPGMAEKPSTPQPNRASVVATPAPQSSPSKGLVGQVSDLIFGW